MQMNTQGLHSPEDAAVTILKRLCSILKFQDVESSNLSEKDHIKKRVFQGLRKKHFLFSNILSECLYNEEDDIVCFLRNVLCYCLLHPDFCQLVEQIAPGSTVILVPWLAVQTLIQKDRNMCGLFYILLARVSGSPLLTSSAQKYSFSPNVLSTLHVCMKKWFEQAREDIDPASVRKILLSYSFQALVVTLRINDYYLREHFSIMYPFVSLAFTILKEKSFDNLNELRLSILAYLCCALEMSSQRIEELLNKLQLKQTLYSLFIFGQTHSTMGVYGLFKGNDELFEENIMFPILLNNFQSIAKQSEQEKKLFVENFANDQIKHANVHIDYNRRRTNALKHFYFLVALATQAPDAITKMLSESSCVPFSGYGDKTLNLWCPVSRLIDFDDEVLAKEPPRSLHILEAAIIAVLSKCATVFVGMSGTGKSHTLILLYNILGTKMKFSQSSGLCNKDGLLWLYLDDDTDPRTLIGAWQTGSEPCSFVWKDGVMVRAMKSGRWVVIENIDRCSSDILETIREIVEYRRITIVERSKTIRAHENFRLFGTITINSVNSTSHSSKSLIQLPQSLHSWKSIFLPEFTKDDILFIALKNFSSLRSILSLLYEAFYCIANLEMIQLSSDLRRNFSNAIFFRYLQHTQSRFKNIHVVFPLLESHKLILIEEFYHTVALSYPYIRFRNFICGKFGEVLGLSLAQIADVVKDKQNIFIENNFLRVGNVAVECNIRSQNYVERGEQDSFHFTTIHAKVMRSMVAAQIHKEPVLLVGSTGSGKTSLVQKFASLMNQNISVYNFNDQSESCDLIGRIVQQDLSSLIGNFNETLTNLIQETTLMKESQKKDLCANIVLLYSLGEWKRYLSFVRNVTGRVQKNLVETKNLNDKIALQHKWSQLDKRLGKLEVHPLLMSESSTQQCVSLHSAKFMFEEGALVTAMRKGQWIVLDEINLAPSDVLQRLKGLLTNFKAPEEDPLPFILTENSGEEIIPHENFRIFACMNPSLEINEDRFSECLKEDSKETSSLIPTMKSSTGKKDLPSDIRGCFSEFYVDEVTDVNDLTAIIQEIIPLCERNLAENVATFYLHARSLCSTYQIATGLGTTPHFSLRTLTRALKFAVSVMKQRWKPQNAKVALMNGIIANFMTGLKETSFTLMMSLLCEKLAIDKSTIAQVSTFKKKTNEKNRYESSSSIIYGIENDGNPGSRFSILKEEMCIPSKYTLCESSSQLTALVENLPLNKCVNPFFMDGCERDKVRRWVSIEGFPIRCGPELIDLYTAHKNLIVTPSVRVTIERIARVLSGSRVPILLEGPTSCGKSSIVKFICQITGHRFVRINNHDHTDVQEYLGQHVVDSITGKLVFVEGVIAQAARQGHWIILDELNLAPSEVLECLNRLLDGNRELFIAETGVTITAHEDFVIFATQNPAGGVYGGRKPLSQAFRNRFIEIACEELPTEELNTILQKRCELPLSFTNAMVNVYKELKARRLKASVFESSSSFMTIRDLLRWGFRKPENHETLAYEGFFLIGERLRDLEEQRVLLDILKNNCFKGKHTHGLKYNFHTDPVVIHTKNELKTLSNRKINISLTHSMTRLIGLVKRAICNDEPVLLVGETGTGKTSVCQLLATLANVPLRIVNCHQQTESADLLGSLQPVKDRLKFFCVVREQKQKLIDLVRSYISWIEDNRDLYLVDIKSMLNDVIKTLHEKIPIDSNVRDTRDVEKAQCVFTDMLNDDGVSEIKKYLIRTQVKLLRYKISLVNRCCEKNPISFFKSPLIKETIQGDSLSENTRKRQNLNSFDCDADLDKTHNGQMPKRLKVDEIYSEESVLTYFEEFLKSLGVSISDLLSSLQQCRSLFQWEDGPLVKCMKDGSYLLLDEISLADDAVLERLNSILEHERSIVLTEKGCTLQTKSANSDFFSEHTGIEIVKAKPTFRIFATMNPGGDFGKRELSPALRNRFTEIWVPAVSFESPDMFNLISETLYHKMTSDKSTAYLGCLDPNFIKSVALILQKTVCWYNTHVEYLLSVREVLSWIDFIISFSCRIIPCNNASTNTFVENIVINALFHGAFLTCIDAFGIGNRVCNKLQNRENTVGLRNINRTAFGELLLNFMVKCISENIQTFSKETLNFITSQFKEDGFAWLNAALSQNSIPIISVKDETYLKLGDFFLPTLEKFHTDTYEINSLSIKCSFNFTTPTTIINLGRIIRALQLPRAILLEGPPGAGKTSIVQSLAVLTGNQLIRINLSEFTDLSDLLGSDLPCATRVSLYADNEVFNKKCLELEMTNQKNAFHWVDGILINAMIKGYWVLLDELNLASQQVLEGLNALLDHRREIYIPELDRVVNCAPSFRLFAAQNPMADGGGRRGIPRSFLNRFSRISVESLKDEDLENISLFTLENVNHSNQEHSTTICKAVIKTIQAVKAENLSKPFTGSASWEYNLRDVFRMLQLLQTHKSFDDLKEAASVVLLSRLCTSQDGYRAIKAISENVQFLNVDWSRFFLCKVFLLQQELECFSSNVVTSKEKDFVHYENETFYKNKCLSKLKTSISLQQEEVIMGRLRLNRQRKNCVHKLSDTKCSIGFLRSQENILTRVAYGITYNWPVLITGPPGSGKSSVVHTLANLCSTKLHIFRMTEFFDVSELLGVYEPETLTDITNMLRHQLGCLIQSITECNDFMSSLSHIDSILERIATVLSFEDEFFVQKFLQNTDGVLTKDENFRFDFASELEALNNNCAIQRLTKILNIKIQGDKDTLRFKWTDGLLVQCVEQGDWILFQHAHLASPAFLDRLNSLLEPNGFLFLTECGESCVIRPHPNFRLFFTLDSSSTITHRVSKALRNRCLEVNMTTFNTADIATLIAPQRELSYPMKSIVNVKYEFIKQFCDIPYILRQLLLEISALAVGSATTTPSVPEFIQFCLSYFERFLNLNPYLLYLNGPVSGYMVDIHEKYRFACCGTIKTLRFADTRLLCVLLGLIAYLFPYSLSFINQTANNKSENENVVSGCSLWKAFTDENKNFFYKLSENIREDGFRHFQEKTIPKQLFQEWMVAAAITSNVRTNVNEFYLYETFCETCTFDWFPTLPIDYRYVIFDSIKIIYSQLLKMVGSATWTTLLSILDSSNMMLEPSLRCHNGNGMFSPMWNIVQIVKDSTLSQYYYKSSTFRHVLQQATTQWNVSDCQKRYQFYQLIVESLRLYFENFLPIKFSSAADFIRIYLSQQVLHPSILVYIVDHYLRGLMYYEGFFTELELIMRDHCASLSNRQSKDSPPLDRFQSIFEEYCSKTLSSDMPESYHKPSDVKRFEINIIRVLTQIYRTAMRIIPYLPSSLDSSLYTEEYKTKESQSLSGLHMLTPVSLWDIRGWVEDSDSHCHPWLSHFIPSTELNRKDTERILSSTWVWGPHEVQVYFNFLKQYVTRVLNDTLVKKNVSLLSRIAGFLDNFLCLCEHQGFHCLFCSEKRVSICSNTETTGYQAQIYSALLKEIREVEMALLQKGTPQRLYIMKDTIGLSFKLEPFKQAFGFHLALNQFLSPATFLQDTLSAIKIKNSYINAQEFLLDFSLNKFLHAGLLDENTKDLTFFHKLSENIIYLKAIVQCINFKQCQGSQAKFSVRTTLNQIWEQISSQCENMISRLDSRQFSTLTETCVQTSNIISDVFVILYFSSLFQMVGEKLHSLMDYGVSATSLGETSKECCNILRLYKKFLLDHVVLILQHASPHCRRLISSSTFDAVAQFVSLIWQLEANIALSDSSFLFSLLSTCSTSCFATSRNLLELFSFESSIPFSTMAQTSSSITTLEDFLVVNSNYIMSLCAAHIYHSENFSTPPKSLQHKIMALDPDSFIAWRSALILNFCSRIDLSVTLAQVRDLSEKVSLLQHLLSSGDEILQDFPDKNIQSAHVCPPNSMCRYWSNYICSGLREFFATLQCLLDEKQCDSNTQKLQTENFMVIQKYTCLCCNDLLILKDVLQMISRTLYSLDSHRETSPTTTKYERFLKNPFVPKLLKLLLLFLEKRCEEISGCLLSVTATSSPCVFTEIKGCSTDSWSHIVCQLIWHISLCRIVICSSQLSAKLEGEIVLQQTLQYSNYHLDSLDFEILFENAISCVEQAACGIPSFRQYYFEMERNDVQAFSQDLAAKLPFRPPVQRQTLSESEKNMYDRLCDTQLLEPLTASTRVQIDQLQNEVSEFVSTTWNNEILEEKLDFMFDTHVNYAQYMYNPFTAQQESVLEFVLFLTKSTLIFCKTIQESYVLFPEITTSLAFCFKLCLYSLLKYSSVLILSAKQHINGMTVFSTNTLGFFSKALDHQPLETLNQTKLHHHCNRLSSHSEENQVDYLLWLCNVYEYALQHSTFINVNMKTFQSYVFQLCCYYQEDYEKKEKKDAEKFATYIQEQNPLHKEHSKQEETDHDRDQRITLSFFPSGSFLSEDSMNEKNFNHDTSLESECLTQMVELIGKPLSTEKSNIQASCSSYSEFHFKSHQLSRFMRLFHNLSNTLHLCSMRTQNFYFSRIPCYSSYLSSISICFDQANASTELFPFFEEDLLRTTLGYTLVPHRNDVLPKAFESIAPFSMNSLLVHALLTYHGLQLQNALKVDDIHSDYNALFKNTLIFPNTSPNFSETSETSVDNPNANEMHIEKNGRASYRYRKIKFQLIQRLLRATPGARFCSSDDSQPASSFYKDAWPAASVGAYPILMKIKEDATRFLTECPEHPVLCDVIQMVDTVTNLPIFTTTTVSLMNILQLVISRCEKWETFAHRQISLKESTAKLTKYLFLLRNHQLSDWRELRNHREEHFSISVTSWAPQLIEFVSQLVHEMYQNVKPKQWATCENIISSLQDQSSLFSKSHVQLLWSYLEQNIFPKPLGEFEARLNIISMASYFFKDQSSICENQAANVLKHFVIYAELVKDKVDKSMEIGRKILDKKINSLLTITAWDFSKPDTLNYSVQKAHHQLAKAITEFDKYLQTPVIEFIAHTSIPDSLRHNNVHIDQQDKRILSNSTSKYSWLENLLTHVNPFSSPSFAESNPLHETDIPKKTDCVSLWITQLTSKMGDCSTDPIYQTFLTEWLLTIHTEIENVIHLLETSDSAHKKYWCADLNQRLKKIHLSFVTGHTDLSFVVTDVGLPYIGTSTHLLLGIPCIPKVSKEFIMSSEHNFQTDKSNDFLASLLHSCTSPTNSMQYFSDLLDSIPKMWKHIQTCLYRQVRQYTILSGQRCSCHADLLNDNSHSLWYKNCCTLLEATQKYVCQLWSISQELTEFLDLLHLASLPSYPVPCGTFRAFFVDFDTFYEAIRQFLFFTQPQNNFFNTSVPQNDDSKYAKNPLSLKDFLNPTSSQANIHHDVTLSTASLVDTLQAFKSPLNLSFTMRVLQILKSTFQLFPEYRVSQRDPTITFLSNHSRSILLQILDFINDVIRIRKDVGPFKVETNHSFAKAIMSTRNVPMSQKHTLIAASDIFCRTLTRLLHCIPNPVLKTPTLPENMNLAPYQASSLSVALPHSVMLEETTNDDQEQVIDVTLQFRQSCSLDFSKITNFLKSHYFCAISVNKSHLEIPQMYFMENNKFLKNSVISGLTLFLSTLDTAIGLAGSGVLILKISTILFKEGYCSDKNSQQEDSNNQESHLNQELIGGTGIGEGDGINDHTDDIMDSDLLDGYKHEKEESHEENQNDKGNQDDSFSEIIDDMQPTLTKPDDNNEDESNESDPDKELGDVTTNEGQMENKKKEDGIENEDLNDNLDSKKQNNSIETENGITIEDSLELAAQKEDKEIQDSSQPETNDSNKQDPNNTPDELDTENFSESDYSQGFEQDAYQFQSQNEKQNENVHNEDDINMDSDVDMDDNEEKDSLEGSFSQSDVEENLSETDQKCNVDHNSLDSTSQDQELCDENELESKTDLSWNVREDKNEYQTAQESQQSFANNQQANGKSSHNHTNDSDVKDTAVEKNNNGESNSLSESQAADERDEMDEKKTTHESTHSGESKADATDLAAQNVAPQTCGYDNQHTLNEDNIPNPLLPENEKAINEWMKQVTLDKETINSTGEEEQETSCDEVKSGVECQEDKSSLLKGLAQAENVSNVNNTDELNKAEGEDTPEKMFFEKTNSNEKLNQNFINEHITRKLEKATAKNSPEDLKQDEKEDSFSNMEDDNEKTYIQETNDDIANTNLNMHQKLLSTCKTQNLIFNEGIIDDISETVLENDAVESYNTIPQQIAKEFWEHYGKETDSSATRLCEQLRIVLEPTLKGRFSDGFRTGKRLSMRKVVAFIASNFRRDKIWLRRTRPSRRDYRILIALDNTRSMSHCSVGPKALKAIITVCTAFQRLELGETGLCAFGGNTPQLILPLKETAYNEDTGTKIIQSFTFDKESSVSYDRALPDMFNLAFKTFGEIPLSQSKCSLQQMLLIISDGRFNKRAVCGKIHEALTCNIIPIFLIIDPLQKSGDNGKRLGIETSQSIYDLKEASWDNDNLHVKNYLDDFPFPFYAVIQSISSIPDVLTDIIRQWIELLK